MVKKYRKKPVCVEAVQFMGNKESAEEIKEWVEKNWPRIEVADYSYEEDYEYDCLEIETPNDDWELDVGDWLIKGVDGSLYPVKDDTFKKVYELADDNDDGIRWI